VRSVQVHLPYNLGRGDAHFGQSAVGSHQYLPRGTQTNAAQQGIRRYQILGVIEVVLQGVDKKCAGRPGSRRRLSNVTHGHGGYIVA